MNMTEETIWCSKCWESGDKVKATCDDDLCAKHSAEEPEPPIKPQPPEVIRLLKDALSGSLNSVCLRKEIYFSGGSAVIEFTRQELLGLDDDKRLFWLNWCLGF